MHFCDRLAVPCMGWWMGAWHGVGLPWGGLGTCFGLPVVVTSLLGGCYLKQILDIVYCVFGVR